MGNCCVRRNALDEFMASVSESEYRELFEEYDDLARGDLASLASNSVKGSAAGSNESSPLRARAGSRASRANSY
jgi:hypothetical protein